MGSSWKFKRYFLLFVLACLLFRSAFAQSRVENSIFWEVTGNDLPHPSYLFGTFHLMGGQYIDSLAQVMTKFGQSKAIVGELLLDSTMTVKMMVAARLHDTTLDRLLKPDEYKATAEWLKELSGYDLKLFNGMNPMTIQIFIMSMLQQKYYPLSGSTDVPMDMYLQQRGKKEGKLLIGLETFETQVNALFTQFSLERQAEMLVQFVKEKEKAKNELVAMNKSYRNGDLGKLEELLSDQTYSEQESKVMLDDRNKKWFEQLPSIMKEQQTFVAVGALHLSGENGLINLFRRAGYTVTPMILK